MFRTGGGEAEVGRSAKSRAPDQAAPPARASCSRAPAVGAHGSVFAFLEVFLMALSWLHRLLKKSRPLSRSGRKEFWQNRFVPNLEALADRIVPTVTAILRGGALLSVVGDALDNTITISRDAAGTIRVNNGQVPILGGTPTVANTALIIMNGLAGNDHLSL